MLPLIKIRATYLKRKKGTLIFSYLLIPTIIIISVLIYIVNKDPEDPIEMDEKKEFNDTQKYYLFKNSSINNYEELLRFLSNTSLVSKNTNIGEKLVNYIYSKTGAQVKLYSSEDKLNNYSQNIIILNYNENKKTYKFTYKEKEIIQYNGTFPFITLFLSSQNASDLFKYDYDNYMISRSHNIIFLKYQAFLATFLIENENKQINKDIQFNLGLNSYPPAIKNSRNYDTIELVLGYLITLQFSFIFLSFSIQMLEEKDLKLEKLLERQGIGALKYILSWLLNF